MDLEQTAFNPFLLLKSGHIVRSSILVKKDKSATYRGRKWKMKKTNSPCGASVKDDETSSPGGASVINDETSSPGGASVIDDANMAP